MLKNDNKMLERINQYKRKIQDFVKSLAKVPRPHDVLAYLLKEYELRGFPVPGKLFSSFSPDHMEFAKTLARKLNQTLKDDDGFSNSDVLLYMDTYLMHAKFQKNDDLLALLIAYFHYYKETYTHLAEHTGLKKKVIIPSVIFDRKRNAANVDRLLIDIDSDNYSICIRAIEGLGHVSIPKIKNDIVFKKLLEIARGRKSSSGYTTEYSEGLACKSIVHCNIPKTELINFLDLLLLKIKKNIRSEVLQTLAILSLPKDLHAVAIQRLFKILEWENIYDGNEILKTLEEMGCPAEMLNKIIESLIYYMGFRNPVVQKQAIKCLMAIKIPEKFHEKIILGLICIVESSDNEELFKSTKLVAYDALGTVPIPTRYLEQVINVLMVAAQHGMSPACKSLAVLGVPKQSRRDVILQLLQQIQTDDYKNYDFILSLSMIPIPADMTEMVRQQLHLAIAMKNYTNVGNGYALSLLCKLELSGKQREDEIKLIFALVKRHQCSLQLFQDLKHEIIPKVLRKIFLEEIVDVIDNSNSGPFTVVCNCKIDPNAPERLHIINKLLLRLATCRTYSMASDIAQALIIICKAGSLSELIATRIKLEEGIRNVKPRQQVIINAAMDRFNDYIKQMQSLPATLSSEVKAEIIQMSR